MNIFMLRYLRERKDRLPLDIVQSPIIGMEIVLTTGEKISAGLRVDRTTEIGLVKHGCNES